ncbi:MAG: glycosyltransferase family 39 protein [Butyrivibrio sp.]|nr:glycosyltransferase family 39 protein [Muribaculum sp.]MCM1552578.1 glycosyltransferase family 39 protein [Butyrivibrio sp.]
MKKNNIPQILIWGCYALTSGASLLMTAMAVSRTSGFSPLAGIVAGIVILAAMGFAIRALQGAADRRRWRRLPIPDGRKRLLWLTIEGLLLVVALIGMIALRMAAPWDVTQESAFELAEVTQGDFTLEMYHRGCELYLYLLHGFLVFLGNKAVAAVLLQMLLLVGAALSLYFGIRRLSGAVAALTVIGFLGFAPFMVNETRKLLPLLMFLIFYGLAVGGIASLPERMRGLYKIYDRVFAVLYYIYVGLLIGFCFYLDAVGITLLIFLTGVICCGRRETENAAGRLKEPEGIVSPEEYLEAMEQESVILGSEVFVFVCCLLSAVLGYVGAHGIRSIGGESVAASIRGQLELYMSGALRIPTVVESRAAFWDVLLLAALMSLGAFGFWYSGRLRDKAMWMFAAVLLAGMQCMGMTSETYSDGFAVLYLFCAAMAGCSLTDLLVVRKTPEETGETEGMDIMDIDAQDNLKLSGQVNDSSVSNEAAPVINYIENPLPLPKKHKPRVLDYDYEVAEDDDFDI